MLERNITSTTTPSETLNETINRSEHSSVLKEQLVRNRKKIYFSGLALLLMLLSFKQWEVTAGSSCTLEVTKDKILVISAQEAGILKEINVKDGDFVEEGAVLGVCEDLDIQKQKVRLNAELEQLNSESFKLQSNRMEQQTAIEQAQSLYNQYSNEAKEMRLEEEAILSSERGEVADKYPPELFELDAQMEVRKIDELTQQLEKQRYESLYQQGLVSQSQLEVIRNRYQIAVKESKAAESRITAMKVSHARKTKAATTQEKMAQQSLQVALQKLNTIDVQIDLVNEQILTKRSELTLLEKKSNQLILRAPRAGVIIGQNIEKKRGQYLERGVELCLLADISQLQAVAEISEWDIAEVKPGTLVRLRMRSLSDRMSHGRVAHIGSEAVVNPETKSRIYYCEINIDNNGNVLRPGMSGFARIVLGKAPGYSFLWRWCKRSIRLDYWT
jgi:multidrug resistance efflux pump